MIKGGGVLGVVRISGGVGEDKSKREVGVRK